MTIKTYNCSQQALYDVCRAGWASCTTYLAEFTSFSPLYTASFIADKLEKVDAAQALPDAEQRTEDSRTLRVELKNKTTEALEQWQRLKRYITKAYPADQLEIKLDAAGQAHYNKAAKDDWGAAANLLTDAVAFATTNSADLELNSNMPPGFPAAYAAIKTAFDALHQSYITTSQTDEVQTQTKITANNGIHAAIMSMFLDGQRLFKNNEAVKKLFTFDQVLLTVTGPGLQGVKGDVTEDGTDLPVANAAVAFSGPTNKTVQTDAEGHYECPQLAAGTYTLQVTAPGYAPLTLNNIEVETGVMKTVDVVVTAV